MGWEFVLAIASFGLLLVGWAVLPLKEQHSKAQAVSPSQGRDLPTSYEH